MTQSPTANTDSGHPQEQSDTQSQSEDSAMATGPMLYILKADGTVEVRPIPARPVNQSTALAAVSALGGVTPVPRTNAKRNPPYCNALQTTPLWHLVIPGEPLALDIEFQEYFLDPRIWPHAEEANGKWHFRLGRVSVVNTLGQVILDTYVFYRNETGVKKKLPGAWRGFGVTWEDLKSVNGAQPAERVEGWLKELLTGRTVIVHGGSHDITAFYIHKDILMNEETTVVDTQDVYAYEVYNRATPGLKATAEVILHKSIQENGHSSVEDALATMELYLHRYSYHGRSLAPAPAATVQTPKAPEPAPGPPAKTWASVAAARPK